MGKTLGLDLGPNSIGWALIDTDDAGDAIGLGGCGVRVFPEGVDNFDTKKERSRNEDRRAARGMRRQVQRRSERKAILRQALITGGLFPAAVEEQKRLLNVDPYPLRARGVDPDAESLTPHEIGRVILHLNQRRGFLSNRKKYRKDNEVKGMLAEIGELADRLGERTLGQHLHEEREANRLSPIRGKHTRRSMIVDEFDRLWRTQATHHADLLTDVMRWGEKGRRDFEPKVPEVLPSGETWLSRYGLFGILFFQRRMYWPASMVGYCELEPKEKRCPKADRLAQRFRLLQEVNNLRLVDPDKHVERPLSAEERTLLLNKLGTSRELTFDQIRKALGFLESVRFNLEKGPRSKLWGLPVDHALRHKTAFGKAWDMLSEGDRDTVVHRLIDNQRDDDAAATWLRERFKLTAAQADEALARGDALPDGYIQLSRMAVQRLLPHMERGLPYQAKDESDSAVHAAGYHRRDELRRRVFDRLPQPDQVRDAPIGDIPNPVVRRTLTELRKVVNAILREHGKPDAVHVEMAREVQMGAEARQKATQRIAERTAERDEAADAIGAWNREHPEQRVKINREAITRYLLWVEQGRQCAYSVPSRTIGFHQLFGGDVDVDHILPKSLTLDDSQMNKVVCFRSVNDEKGQRWPHHWLADADPARYDVICQRAKSLPYPKYRRFLQKEVKQDEFINRQLTDTGYIARATGEYLRCLFDQPHRVLGIKGQLTAELRHQWGLNTLLEEMPDSPAWREDATGKQPAGPKNRADHRHHALDAVVVALTDRSRLQHLSRIRKDGGTRETGEVLPEPWAHFRSNVSEALQEVNVSHRVQRKVSGGLHEDTIYGPTDDPDVFVVRKPVEALSPNEIKGIRDDAVRNVVMKRLADHGITIGRGARPPREKWMRALADPDHPLRMSTKDESKVGPLIKNVRILRGDKTIEPIREGSGDAEAWVKPGSTHHLCIFEWLTSRGKKKRRAVWVTMLEATKRLKRQADHVRAVERALATADASPKDAKQRLKDARREAAELFPLIDRRPPGEDDNIPPDAEFVMSLSRGELVSAKLRDGSEALLVFKTSASTQGQLYFARHTDARKSGEQEKIVFNANTLDARKVTVDPLGRIRWAND